jgi:hypothetical protein
MSLPLIQSQLSFAVDRSESSPTSEKSSIVKIIETHEEFVERIERGGGKMRLLSSITILVSALLFFSYVAQLSLPYVTGESSQTVNLADPALQGVEILVTGLALLWLYIGIDNLLFTRRLERSIKEIRALEKELEQRLPGEVTNHDPQRPNRTAG